MLRFLAVSGQIAWKALSRNRLRSGLTTLGVVIGVAAVIAMVTLGSGATAKIRANIGALGDDLLTIMPEVAQRQGGQAAVGAPFEHADVDALRRELPGLSAWCPPRRSGSRSSRPAPTAARASPAPPAASSPCARTA